MKMFNLLIGRYATVGTSCVVLYDSVVGPGATLKSRSLLMKGEQLPANIRWQCIPAHLLTTANNLFYNFLCLKTKDIMLSMTFFVFKLLHQ
jgi:hypothetical protein